MENSHKDSPELRAVITGDFIGFSDLDVELRRRMPKVMNRCGKSLRSDYAGIMNHEIAVFRGDGWQAMVESPGMALRAALFIRAYILAEYAGHKIDTRMAIGIGTIDYVPAGQVSAGDGAAFRNSGRLLERMTGSNQGRIRYSHPGSPNEKLVDGLVRLAGALSDSWSSRQARAVLGALKFKTQVEIARDWPDGISRQAVGRHLFLAGWPAIAHALFVFEEYMRA